MTISWGCYWNLPWKPKNGLKLVPVFPSTLRCTIINFEYMYRFQSQKIRLCVKATWNYNVENGSQLCQHQVKSGLLWKNYDDNIQVQIQYHCKPAPHMPKHPAPENVGLLFLTAREWPALLCLLPHYTPFQKYRVIAKSLCMNVEWGYYDMFNVQILQPMRSIVKRYIHNNEKPRLYRLVFGV